MAVGGLFVLLASNKKGGITIVVSRGRRILYRSGTVTCMLGSRAVICLLREFSRCSLYLENPQDLPLSYLLRRGPEGGICYGLEIEWAAVPE